jgi:hypothetical protein
VLLFAAADELLDAAAVEAAAVVPADAPFPQPASIAAAIPAAITLKYFLFIACSSLFFLNTCNFKIRFT